LVALPLAAWMTYVRVKFGPAEDPGLGNFTYPLAGYWERLSLAWREARGPEEGAIYWATFATVGALAVQALFCWDLCRHAEGELLLPPELGLQRVAFGLGGCGLARRAELHPRG
jgi:hypothetical protein